MEKETKRLTKQRKQTSFPQQSIKKGKLIKKLNLTEKNENNILKIVAKELYSKNRVTTSASKITTNEEYVDIVNEGEIFEIIGLDYTLFRSFVLEFVSNL